MGKKRRSPQKSPAKVTPKVEPKADAKQPAQADNSLRALMFSPQTAPGGIVPNRDAKGGRISAKGGNSVLRGWVADQVEGDYDRDFAEKRDLGADFKVDEGQLTFDAEGTEGGRYHSRTPEWPGGASGVTIGRGYDLGQRPSSQITEEMSAAGMSAEAVAAYLKSQGLQGEEAHAWLKKHKDELPEISAAEQKKLFEIAYDWHKKDVQRISDKPDTQEKYGEVDLSRTDPTVRDLLVDLRMRGDYTSGSRKKVQGLASNNDLVAMSASLNDRRQWPNVPPDRFQRRAAYARQGVQELRAEENLPFTFAAPLEQLGNPNLDLYGRPRQAPDTATK